MDKHCQGSISHSGANKISSTKKKAIETFPIPLRNDIFSKYDNERLLWNMRQLSGTHIKITTIKSLGSQGHDDLPLNLNQAYGHTIPAMHQTKLEQLVYVGKWQQNFWNLEPTFQILLEYHYIAQATPCS